MAHLLPRKIKKACKSTRRLRSYKTKWMQYVHTQLQGYLWMHTTNDGKCYYEFDTKYGVILIRYLDKTYGMLNHNYCDERKEYGTFTTTQD